MNAGPHLFGGREKLGSFALLLLVTGFAFVFSMPSATYVSEILGSPLTRGTPIIFFAVYVLAFVVFGVNRGASSAAAERWSLGSLLRSVVHVGTGFVLTVPYLVYIRITILPLDRDAIVWIGAYALVSAISFALLGQWLEVRSSRLGREYVFARYFSAGALIAVPMAFHFAPPGIRLLSLVSPLSCALRIFEGATAAELGFAFAMPVVGFAVGLLLTRREVRRHRVRL